MFFARFQFGLRACGRDFQLRPLAPKVDSRCRFQNICDVRAADARRDFEKVEIAVSIALDELSMRRAGLHAHRLDQAAIDFQQLLLVQRIVRNRLRNIRAAAVRNLQRRSPVFVDAREGDATIADERVDVKDFAGDEPCQDVI